MALLLLAGPWLFERVFGPPWRAGERRVRWRPIAAHFVAAAGGDHGLARPALVFRLALLGQLALLAALARVCARNRWAAPGRFRR